MSKTNPTTKLEAVNSILGAIGQSPVSTLPSAAGVNALVDGINAESTLDEVTRAVLLEGWHFNSDEYYSLSPDVNNEILVPSTALKIDPSSSSHHDFVWRQGKLWDKKEHSFTIHQDVKFNIVWAFRFDEIPEAFRRYILIRSGRVFNARWFGSDNVDGYTEEDEYRSRAEVERADLETADITFLDDYDSIQTTNRHVNFYPIP